MLVETVLEGAQRTNKPLFAFPLFLLGRMDLALFYSWGQGKIKTRTGTGQPRVTLRAPANLCRLGAPQVQRGTCLSF